MGGRVILLICESCRRPLEDESLSGRVTYSDNVHTEGGSDLSSGLGVGGGVCVWGWGWGVVMLSYRELFFPEILMDLNWEIN